jgi:formate-dependent nitrite reductase membrane component NrfD
VILVGLAAMSVGISGVFANLLYGEGYLALAGLAISFTSITLGLILFIMGLRNKWRE